MDGLSNATDFSGLEEKFDIAYINGYQDQIIYNPSPTPEPATFVLLGLGLIGCVSVRRRFTK